ncbi:MAG TPA: lasso peptide biosynthesis B2 protein [Roseateles sp.]
MQTIHAPAPQYRLADHVRACRVDEQVILLDLRRNKYLGFRGRQVDALSQIIVDWPGAQTGTNNASPNLSAMAALQPLLVQHLLSKVGTGVPAGPLLPQALECVDPDAPLTRLHGAGRDLLRLAIAAAGAALWLSRFNLAEIASRVARRRALGGINDARENTLALRDAVSSYMRLRPFLFTAQDKCLHDSVTLIRFLARRRMFPAWVIGVRIRPFGAHSWVQSGSLVLNDVHEHVRTYTPILVV